ncbi:MAG: hypothetical protein WBB16_11460 [Aestuariivirga sp.]
MWTEANMHLSKLVPELRMAAAEQLRVARRNPCPLFIGMVLAINLILILIYPVASFMHGLHWISFDKAAFWHEFSVASDGSVPEVAGYLQLAAAAAAMAVLTVKSGARTYFSWVIILAYAIADDSLLIHELAGAKLAQFFPGTWGPQGLFVGELIYFATTGAFLALIFAYSYVQSERKHRARSVLLLLPFGMLAFFAVLFDYFRESIRGISRLADFFVGMIEDGSELLCMSIIMLLAIGLVIASSGETVRQRPVGDQVGA